MRRVSVLTWAFLLGGALVAAGCGGNGDTGEGGSGGDGTSGGHEGGKYIPCDHEVVAPDPIQATWNQHYEHDIYDVATVPGGGLVTVRYAEVDGWGCRISRLDDVGVELWTTVLTTIPMERATSKVNRVDCESVAADGAGNVYVAGNFVGGIAEPELTTTYDDLELLDQETGGMGPGPTEGNVGDLFVAKLDGTGEISYLKNFGSAGGDAGARIAVAPDGTLALTGSFSGGANFGQGYEGTNSDLHVASLAPDGTLLWSTFLSPAAGAYVLGVEDVAIGPSGEVYVSGNSNNYLTMTLARIDDGVTTFRVDHEGAWFDDPKAGTPWLPSMGPRLAVGADGNVVMAGNMGRSYIAPSTIDFGTGPVTGTAYLVTVAPDGQTLWSMGLAADGVHVAVEPSGALHVTGRVDEGLQIGIPPVAVNAAKFDMFVAKLRPSGELVSSMAGISSEVGPLPIAIATDADGDDTIAGNNTGVCDIHFGHGALPLGGFLVGVHP